MASSSSTPLARCPIGPGAPPAVTMGAPARDTRQIVDKDLGYGAMPLVHANRRMDEGDRSAARALQPVYGV